MFNLATMEIIVSLEEAIAMNSNENNYSFTPEIDILFDNNRDVDYNAKCNY